MDDFLYKNLPFYREFNSNKTNTRVTTLKEHKTKQMKYFQPEIECVPLHQLRLLQNERLRKTIALAYNTIPYYKLCMDNAGVLPKDIQTVDDLYRLPFTYKSALREEYPFGLFTQPAHSLTRLHCSSGTTGKPIVVGYTHNDVDMFAQVVARSLVAAGCQPGMILQNAYGYGLFTGGLGLHYGAEKLGMCVLPISGGFTEKQIMLMQDFQTDVLTCTPSYAQTLAEAIKQKGIDPNDLNLKIALLGAEPWTEATRSDVELGLGVHATNIYGLSELIGPGVAQEDYEEKGTGSYIWEDHFYPEIVDKDTGQPLPYGEKGVLVLTSLTKEAMPMLRYYTNDIASLSYDYSAKRTHIKMSKIYGRADDMLIIRGVNLFPTQIEAIIEHIPELSSHYLLLLTHPNKMDEIEVQVELHANQYEELAKISDTPLQHDIAVNAIALLQKRIKEDIGLTMKITCCAPFTLPRSEGGKQGKVKDLRNS